MKVTEAGTESTHQSHASAELTPYVFWLVLLLAGLVGLLIRVHVGRKTYISFDEWQHVFMAASARWTDLSFELRTNSHPPLFFLLLGGIVRLGRVAFYRSISIAAGTGSIIVVGLIARRIFRSPTIQLLCATSFALSAAAIAISVEIRSYQLTIFLILVALYSWFDMFPQSGGPIRARPCITFAICSTLAVFCHYSAVFFLGACVAVPFLLAAIFPRLRERWIRTTPPRSVWLVASALAVPFLLFTIEYLVHIRFQVLQGYNTDFYRGGIPSENALSFLIRNSRNFLNLFSPLEFQSTTAFLVVFGLFLACAAWVLFRYWRKYREAAEDVAAPILFALVMVLEIVVASLARKYPFGGMLRHQYIAGPFLLIAAFAIVDALVALVGPPLRRAIPALLLTAVIANLTVQLPKLIIYPGAVILKDEFTAWRAAFPDTHAVYLDHWSVIGYFIHTSDRPRRFVRRIPDAARIDQFQIADGTPDGTQIFYDKTRDNLDLRDPSVYQSFAACLRGSGVKELGLFYFSAGDKPLALMSGNLEKLVVQKAAEQGLTTTKVIAGETSLLAAFRLRE